jgi:hypothetical protein
VLILVVAESEQFAKFVITTQFANVHQAQLAILHPAALVIIIIKITIKLQKILLFFSTAPVVSEPCNPSPCGPNADCSVGVTKNPICTCRPGFYGDPQSNRGCGPECTTNSECQLTQACINQKCRDPCPGACGINAACRVTGHNPVCSCVPGYTGNPYQNCNPIVVSPVVTPTLAPPISYPQQPPRPDCPNCKPECVLNSDCSPNLACINAKCRDPCPGICGQNAVCKVNNHNPICSCLQGYQGDPTRSCAPRRNNSFNC